MISLTSTWQHTTLTETDIHVPNGIRTHNPNKWAAAKPRLRPLGHWDRQVNLNIRITLNLSITKIINKGSVVSKISQNITGVVTLTRRISGRLLIAEASGCCECRLWRLCDGQCSSETGLSSSRARSEPDGTRWRTGGEVKRKLANGVGSQYSHATYERGLSNITQADAHTSAASSRLNWRPHRFKLTRPFRGKTKSGFCACAITFRTSYTSILSCPCSANT